MTNCVRCVWCPCAGQAGFVELQRQSVETAYTRDTQSLMRTVYDSQFWTMQKPAAGAAAAAHRTPNGA